MSILDLCILGVGLAMDAFAVSVGKGLGMSRINKKQTVTIALFFGGFQALMPLIGYLVGSTFATYVTRYANYIAFVLLVIIGVKMIVDACRERREETALETDAELGIGEMFLLAIATSIDALAVGVTFAFYDEINIVMAIAIIGIITAVIATIGVIIGNVFGSRYRFPASVTGGVILILLGIKILVL